jgi:hypothetical protein
MPVRIDISDYLDAYRGSAQAESPDYYHRVHALARAVEEQARAAVQAVTKETRVMSSVTGTTIDVKSLTEDEARGPIDLKPGLLAGRSARVSQKGVRYAVVPFRKYTPGRGKGGLYSLPRDIYRAALAGQKIAPGTEMGERFWRFGYGGEPWTTGPFANLTRYETPWGRGSRYYTFRTVTSNSPPLSWLRPPKLANREITGRIIDQVRQGIPELVRAMLGDPEFYDEAEEEAG